MKFRTEIKLDKGEDSIALTDKVVFLGSCFALQIGAAFERYKFGTTVNPDGIIYNPKSILQSIDRAMRKDLSAASAIFRENDQWHSFDHHSSLSADNAEALKENIQEANDRLHEGLKNCAYLFLTFGSAWVYRYKKTSQIVSNCHKIPNKEFDKKLIELDTLVSSYKTLFADLLKFNPSLKIILTVSPVRHWKDGYRNNTISKSLLHLFCEKMSADEYVDYFPAYELVMDDLRDYRFYNEDLLHPDPIAIEYIWEQFQNRYFSSQTKEAIRKIDALNKLLLHRPNHQKQKHYESILVKMDHLKSEYPHLDYSVEKDQIQKRLNSV